MEGQKSERLEDPSGGNIEGAANSSKGSVEKENESINPYEKDADRLYVKHLLLHPSRDYWLHPRNIGRGFKIFRWILLNDNPFATMKDWEKETNLSAYEELSQQEESRSDSLEEQSDSSEEEEDSSEEEVDSSDSSEDETDFSDSSEDETDTSEDESDSSEDETDSSEEDVTSDLGDEEDTSDDSSTLSLSTFSSDSAYSEFD